MSSRNNNNKVVHSGTIATTSDDELIRFDTFCQRLKSLKLPDSEEIRFLSSLVIRSPYAYCVSEFLREETGSSLKRNGFERNKSLLYVVDCLLKHNRVVYASLFENWIESVLVAMSNEMMLDHELHSFHKLIDTWNLQQYFSYIIMNRVPSFSNSQHPPNNRETRNRNEKRRDNQMSTDMRSYDNNDHRRRRPQEYQEKKYDMDERSRSQHNANSYGPLRRPRSNPKTFFPQGEKAPNDFHEPSSYSNSQRHTLPIPPIPEVDAVTTQMTLPAEPPPVNNEQNVLDLLLSLQRELEQQQVQQPDNVQHNYYNTSEGWPFRTDSYDPEFPKIMG